MRAGEQVRLEQFDEEPLREHLADMDWVEQTARAPQARAGRGARQMHTDTDAALSRSTATRTAATRCSTASATSSSAALRGAEGKARVGREGLRETRPDAVAPRPTAPKPGRRAAPPTCRAGSPGATRMSSSMPSSSRPASSCTPTVRDRGRRPARDHRNAPRSAGRDEPMILNAFYLVPTSSTRRSAPRSRRCRTRSAAQGIASR